MKIIFTPVGMEESVIYEKKGDILVVDGEEFDFSRMIDGDIIHSEAIKSTMFRESVERKGGKLNVTLVLPNPRNYSPEQAFPSPMENVPDGIIDLPKGLPEDIPLEAIYLNEAFSE